MNLTQLPLQITVLQTAFLLLQKRNYSIFQLNQAEVGDPLHF